MSPNYRSFVNYKSLRAGVLPFPLNSRSCGANRSLIGDRIPQTPWVASLRIYSITINPITSFHSTYIFLSYSLRGAQKRRSSTISACWRLPLGTFIYRNLQRLRRSRRAGCFRLLRKLLLVSREEISESPLSTHLCPCRG